MNKINSHSVNSHLHPRYHRASWGKHLGFIDLNTNHVIFYNSVFLNIISAMQVLNQNDDYSTINLYGIDYIYNISNDTIFNTTSNRWMPFLMKI